MSTDHGITICPVSRRNMYWVFFWPKLGEESNPGKSYYFRLAFYFLTTENLEKPLTENIAILIALCGIYCILIIFLCQRSKIVLLLQDLSNFEPFGTPPDFQKEQQRLNLLANALFIYSFGGTTIYGLIKFLQKNECETFNREKNLSGNCGLIVPFWTPFETKHPLVFATVFSYCFICSHLMTKPSIVVPSYVFEMTSHIILRIKQLSLMITECFKINNYHINNEKLKQCIAYHNTILELDSCFSNTMFAHLIVTTAACACLEKQFMENDRLCAGLYMFGWIISLLIPCIAGQLLLNAGESLCENIWFSKWYEADPKLKRDMQFLLARSQKEMFITVGAFGITSFPLFVSVLKMSYSILCLLTYQ